MKTLTRMYNRIHLWLLPVIIISLRFPQRTFSCPHPCACYVNTEVHCTFRSLATVPARIPKHVERINLGFNSIQSVPENAFSGLSKLEMLLIHSNDVQNIPNGAFRDLSSLQVFKMSYNKLSVITSHTFYGLYGLTRLHVDHNKIEYIHPNAFNGLTALRLLHLEGNLLHQLHPHTFCTFNFLDYFRQSTLKHLYLSDNMIQTLPADMIQTMPLLENLYLHGNPWSCDCQLKWLLEWDEQSNGVLKCKKDKSYENGQLCPMCSTPRHLQNQEIQGLKDMSCSRPLISSPLRKKNSEDEDDDNDLPSLELNRDFIGNIILNMTDEHGNNVNLECQIKKTDDFSKIQWNQLHPEEIDINATFALDFECPMTRDNYERLWKLIAYYSEVPVKLERELLFTDSSKVTYRYKQNLDHDSYYYTGVRAVVSAEPEWVMQNIVKLQLNRRKSTGRKVTLSFSTQLSQSLNTKDIQYPKKSWVMINRNEKTKTSYSVIKGHMCHLNCNVKSSEAPTIEWSLPDGTTLKAPFSDDDSKYSISPSGQLAIEEVDFSDSGLYHCIAQVKHEVDTLPVRVVVQPPANEISERNIKVVTKTNGEPITLACNASANPDAEVSWILPNNNIINSGTNNTGVFLLSNGSLFIPNTKLTDSGLYRCIAVNQYGEDRYSVEVAILKKLSENVNKLTVIKTRPIVKVAAKPKYDLIDDDRGSGEREIEEEKDRRDKLQDRVTYSKDKKNSAGRGQGKYNRKDRKLINTLKNAEKEKDINIAEGRRKFESRKRLIGGNKQIDPKQWASILAKVRGINVLKTTEVPELTTYRATTTPALTYAATTLSSLAEPSFTTELETEEEASADEDELLFITSSPKVTIRQYDDLTTLPDDSILAVTEAESEDYIEVTEIVEIEEDMTTESPASQTTLVTPRPPNSELDNINIEDSIYSTGEEEITSLSEDEDTINEITDQKKLHTPETDNTNEMTKVRTDEEYVIDYVFTEETQTMASEPNFDTDSIDVFTTPSYDIEQFSNNGESTEEVSTQYYLEESIPTVYETQNEILFTTMPNFPEPNIEHDDDLSTREVDNDIMPPSPTATTIPEGEQFVSNAMDNLMPQFSSFIPTQSPTTASEYNLEPAPVPESNSFREGPVIKNDDYNDLTKNNFHTDISHEEQMAFVETEHQLQTTTLSSGMLTVKMEEQKVTTTTIPATTSMHRSITTTTPQPLTHSNFQYPRRRNNGRRRFRPNRFRYRQNQVLPMIPSLTTNIMITAHKPPITETEAKTTNGPPDNTGYQNAKDTHLVNIDITEPTMLQTSTKDKVIETPYYATTAAQTPSPKMLGSPLGDPDKVMHVEQMSGEIDSTKSTQEHVTLPSQRQITIEDGQRDSHSPAPAYPTTQLPLVWNTRNPINTPKAADNYVFIDVNTAITTPSSPVKTPHTTQAYNFFRDLKYKQTSIPRQHLTTTLPIQITQTLPNVFKYFNKVQIIPQRFPTTTAVHSTQKIATTVKKDEYYRITVPVYAGGKDSISRSVNHVTPNPGKYVTVFPITRNMFIPTTHSPLTPPRLQLLPTQPSFPKTTSSQEAVNQFIPTQTTKQSKTTNLPEKQNELDQYSFNKNKIFQSKQENFKETYTSKSNNSILHNTKYFHQPRVVNNHHYVTSQPYHIPARATMRPPYIGTHGPLRHYFTNQPFSVTNKPEITAYTAQSFQERKTNPPQIPKTTPMSTTTTAATTTAAVPLYRPRPVTPNKYNQGQRLTPYYRPFGNNVITDGKGTAIRFPYQMNPYYLNPRIPYRFNRTRPFQIAVTSKPNPPPFVASDNAASKTTPISTTTTTVSTPAITRTSRKFNFPIMTTTTVTPTRKRQPVPTAHPYWNYLNLHQRPQFTPSKTEPTWRPPAIAKVQESKPRIITTGYQLVSLPYEVDAIFPCETVGEPKPTITWTKLATGAVMSLNTRLQRFEVLNNGTLHIQKIQLQDRGQYMCTAQNKHGIDKMAVTLAVVSQQPKILSSRYRDILIYLGDTIIMECNATGIPTPQISWILPDRRIVHIVSTTESRVMLFANGSLSIKEVTFPDRGNYKCVASSVAGADSLTVKLQVSPLPPLIQQEKIENISLPQSHSIYIHCSAKGAPPPTVRWVLSDGTQVRPSQYANGNLFVFPNGTLYIRNSSPKDIGKYECIAANVVGAARRTVYLEVTKYVSNAKITASSPQKTDVSYGGTLRLDCSAAGDPWPRIMWRLPSKRLVDSFFSFDSRIKTFANGTLIIYAVTEKDAGDYLCMARNKLGEDYLVLKVNVMMKPAKIQYKNDADHKVSYGGDLKVDCVATGVPNPEISWSLPDGSLINNVMQSDDSGIRTRRYVVFNNGTLYFNDVGMKEEGDYTCYATNQIGKDEMRVSVKIVAEMPLIKNKTFSIINVPYGDVITVPCQAKGEPVPRITWLSPSNRPIPASSDKYQIYQDGTLLIQKTQRSDNGNYTCLAQNTGGEDKKVVQINVNVLPPIINGFPDKIMSIKESAMKDSRLLIDCKAEGIPTPRVMWAFPEGVILPAPYFGNRIAVHRNGTLDIKVLRKTDSVQLVCIARNEGGEAKLIAQLTVTEPAVKPQFTTNNENVVVAEGQSAKLNCSAVGIPQPDLVWILPNGTEIHSGKFLHRTFHSQDGTLLIGSVATADSGTYRCRAINLAGSIERLVTLQIGQKPQMNNNYNNLVSIINGETLQLHCTTKGESRARISWILPNGIVLDEPQVKGRISLLQNGTLVVRDTSVYDRGSYQCKATTQYGSSSMTVPVIVIAYPPRITTSPAPVIYTRPGSSVQLNCMSIGIPKAEIMWELPDKSHLTAGAQSRLYGNKFLHPQGTLVIQHASKRDSGYYKCTAKNILGSDTKSSYIHVY
ncbi:matrix-remodeling-associated protein 5 [Gastrophryne carolinensis]